MVDLQAGAEALIREPESGLRLQAGRLRLDDLAAERRLFRLLDDPSGEAAQTGRGVALIRGRGQHGLEILVLEAPGARA